MSYLEEVPLTPPLDPPWLALPNPTSAPQGADSVIWVGSGVFLVDSAISVLRLHVFPHPMNSTNLAFHCS